MKKHLSILLTLAMIFMMLSVFPLAALAENTSGGYSYIVESGEVTITDFHSNEYHAYIPATLSGYPVTSIGESAFSGCTGLTSITIPDSVTSIGNHAFSGCTKLMSISIPDSVTSIGESAFYNTAYYNNDANWADELLYIGNYLIKAKSTISGTVVIRNGTKVIADNVFSGYTGLTSITIPDSVTTIGESAFYLCTGLTSLTIPDSVTTIDNYAFFSCTKLVSVKIGNGVTSIGESAFSSCTRLASITIPDSVTSIYDSTFYNTAYYNNDANWTEGLLYIGNNLIKAKSTISGTVVIRNGTKVIADNVFFGCTELTSITIPDSVTSIGTSAFSGCEGLTSITIPDSVTSIGESAFSGCTRLVSIAIPDSVTSIGESTFSDCEGLTRITIPDGVTSIGASAFSGCTRLASITIPVNVTSIGENAFFDCVRLRDIYYTGRKTNWNKISIASGNNEYFMYALFHFSLLGDANGDNAVNMKDVLALRQYIASLTKDINLVNADANEDGVANMKDVLLLRKYLAGLIRKLGK